MSGGISIGFVDFPDLLFDFVHVRRVSISLLLVGNWCGPRPTVEISAGLGFGRRRFRCRTRCGNHLLKLRLSARDPLLTRGVQFDTMPIDRSTWAARDAALPERDNGSYSRNSPYLTSGLCGRA